MDRQQTNSTSLSNNTINNNQNAQIPQFSTVEELLKRIEKVSGVPSSQLSQEIRFTPLNNSPYAPVPSNEPLDSSDTLQLIQNKIDHIKQLHQHMSISVSELDLLLEILKKNNNNNSNNENEPAKNDKGKSRVGFV
jgi:hypothetical protein